FERMSRHPANIALHVEYLYDAHTQRYIQGVKIFRHDIVKRYPFHDVEGCEIDQIQRLRSDGYDYVVVRPPQGPDPFRDRLGLHGTEYTRDTAYLRYFVLQRLQRRRNSESWATLDADLAEQFRKEPSDVNFFALMGSLAGKTAPLAQSDGEKDFRMYSDTPGF